MIIPNIWKNKKCSKPPTRFYICLCILSTIIYYHRLILPYITLVGLSHYLRWVNHNFVGSIPNRTNRTGSALLHWLHQGSPQSPPRHSSPAARKSTEGPMTRLAKQRSQGKGFSMGFHGYNYGNISWEYHGMEYITNNIGIYHFIIFHYHFIILYTSFPQ